VAGQRDRFVADVVVPVPLHRQREQERGYNQAAPISKPLLTLEERWESVRGAFATRPGSQVDNLRVLLIDDVLTTGANLEACARALREACQVGGWTYRGTRSKKSPAKLRRMVE
jgi:predicted amidophosphoribosyltransferase